MNADSTKNISQTDWEWLDALTDEEIDYTDIPPLDETFFSRAQLRLPHKFAHKETTPLTRKAIYPGTFDPVHYGHLNLMTRAAAMFDELIVAVFDHGRPTKSVLFSVDERVQMIEEALPNHTNITISRFNSLTVDFARQVGANIMVRGLRVFSDFEFEFRMALANQRLAPEIEVVTLITREEHTFLSSSTVREIASFHGDVTSMVPPHVATALYARFHGENNYSAPALRD